MIPVSAQVSPPWEIFVRRRRPRHVLPPRPRALTTPVPAHPGPRPHRHRPCPNGSRVSRRTTVSGPTIPTLDHGPVGLEPLPEDLESEFIEAAERGQVRAQDGSVMHVDVFRRTGSVRTPILEDLDA